MIEDLAPRQVWEALMSNPDAALCDVRTNAEWSFVGVPDLSQTGKQPVLIQWQVFPTMQPNPKFVEALATAKISTSSAAPARAAWRPHRQPRRPGTSMCIM